MKACLDISVFHSLSRRKQSLTDAFKQYVVRSHKFCQTCNIISIKNREIRLESEADTLTVTQINTDIFFSKITLKVFFNTFLLDFCPVSASKKRSVFLSDTCQQVGLINKIKLNLSQVLRRYYLRTACFSSLFIQNRNKGSKQIKLGQGNVTFTLLCNLKMLFVQDVKEVK